MLIFVISCNLALTAFNLYIALCLWRVRRTLIRITRTLAFAERRIERILPRAPEFMLHGQQEIYSLKLYYQQLGFQLEQLQKLVSFVNLGIRILRWQTRRRRLQNKRY